MCVNHQPRALSSQPREPADCFLFPRLREAPALHDFSFQPKLCNRDSNFQNLEARRNTKFLSLKLPILVHRFDSPLKFLSKCFGKELFNGHIEFLRKDYRQAGVNVILLKSAVVGKGVREWETDNLRCA